jgi:hypothetical protein
MSKFIGNMFNNIIPKYDDNINTPFKARPIKLHRLQRTNINNSPNASVKNISLDKIQQPGGVQIIEDISCISQNSNINLVNYTKDNNCCEPNKALLKFKQTVPRMNNTTFLTTKSFLENRNYSIQSNNTTNLFDKYNSELYFGKYNRNEFYTNSRIIDFNIYYINDFVSVNNKSGIFRINKMKSEDGGTFTDLSSPQLFNEITHIEVKSLNGTIVPINYSKYDIQKIGDYNDTNIHKVFYKPSNHIFAINNAASSSNRTSRLKYVNQYKNNQILHNKNNLFLSEITPCTTKFKNTDKCKFGNFPPIIFSKNNIPSNYLSLLTENDIRSKNVKIQFRVPLDGNYYIYLGANKHSYIDNESVSFYNVYGGGNNRKYYYDVNTPTADPNGKFLTIKFIQHQMDSQYNYWFEDTNHPGNVSVGLKKNSLYTLEVNSDYDDNNFDIQHDVFICIKHTNSTQSNFIKAIIDMDLYLNTLIGTRIRYFNDSANLAYNYPDYYNLYQGTQNTTQNGDILSKTIKINFSSSSQKNYNVFFGGSKNIGTHNHKITFPSSLDISGSSIDDYYNVNTTSYTTIDFAPYNELVDRTSNYKYWLELPSITQTNIVIKNVKGEYSFTVTTTDTTFSEDLFIKIVESDNVNEYSNIFEPSSSS